MDVRTGDELQALGESFNAMAGDLQRQFEQLHALSVGTLEALARTIDAKSPWTAGHSTRVAEVALAVARAMHFDAPALERIRRGALLHDIGKIGISADILDSPAPLTDEQMAIVREHPALGARILEPLPHCADILPMVLQHHERFDGGGYPAGLAGTGIALDARVLAVADVYDAITSDRPYRRGLPPRDAAVRISEGGRHPVRSRRGRGVRRMRSGTAASRSARRTCDWGRAPRRCWAEAARLSAAGGPAPRRLPRGTAPRRRCPLATGAVERRLAAGRRLEVGALLDEQLDDPQVSGAGRLHQRSRRLGALHVESDRDQRPDELDVPVAGGGLDRPHGLGVTGRDPRRVRRQTRAQQLDADAGERLSPGLATPKTAAAGTQVPCDIVRLIGGPASSCSHGRHVTLGDRIAQLLATRRGAAAARAATRPTEDAETARA